MLENFDQAKRDLADVRDELSKFKNSRGTTSEIDFLKSRSLDLLQDIYVDSCSIRHVVSNFAVFNIPNPAGPPDCSRDMKDLLQQISGKTWLYTKRHMAARLVK